jgi:hypothetical protein
MALLILIFLVSLVSMGRCCVATLKEAGSFETQGSAGFKFFTAQDGRVQLAAANFWDGKSKDMSALNPIMNVHFHAENKSLTFSLQDTLAGRGAHGVELMTDLGVEGRGPARQQYLAIPFYYGCAYDKTEKRQGGCAPIAILSESEDPGRWEMNHRLPADGPSHISHFRRKNETYMVIAENFGDRVTVHKLSKKTGEFDEVQRLTVSGTGATAAAYLRGPDAGSSGIVLVAASYNSPDASFESESEVFLWKDSQDSAMFKQIQTIETSGAHDVEVMGLGDGSLLLFVSEDRNSTTPRIRSGVFRMEPTKTEQAFKLVTRLPTDGAHGAKLFVYDSKIHIAVANFGNRAAEVYDSHSALWVLDAATNTWGLAAAWPTVGATDIEVAVIDGHTFIGVSEEGDLTTKGEKKKVFSKFWRYDSLVCADTKQEL